MPSPQAAGESKCEKKEEKQTLFTIFRFFPTLFRFVHLVQTSSGAGLDEDAVNHGVLDHRQVVDSLRSMI